MRDTKISGKSLLSEIWEIVDVSIEASFSHRKARQSCALFRTAKARCSLCFYRSRNVGPRKQAFLRKAICAGGHAALCICCSLHVSPLCLCLSASGSARLPMLLSLHLCVSQSVSLVFSSSSTSVCCLSVSVFLSVCFYLCVSIFLSVCLLLFFLSFCLYFSIFAFLCVSL